MLINPEKTYLNSLNELKRNNARAESLYSEYLRLKPEYKNKSRFYIMFCLCDTARVLAFENSLHAARKFHIDFANDFFVFDYVYADAWVNKAEH